MIEKTKVHALPFVDGMPDVETRPDQTRVKWMKNGECMDAATSSITNEGSLNRAGVDIQKNVVQVHDDLNKVNETVSDVIDAVNRHSDILDQTGDLDLIETVRKHTDEIETLNFAVVQSDERLEAVEKIATDNRTNIGAVPEHDNSGRNVREELEFQKQEMGSYPGFDYNGMPDPDSTGTGIKNRLAQNTMQITNHQSRINELETNWASSDVGSLTREVNNLRSEVGPRREAQVGHSVYNRLGKLEQSNSGRDKDLQLIQEQIGFSSFPRPTNPTLIHLVDENRSEIEELLKSSAASNQRIAIVETKIGSETQTGSIMFNQRLFMTEINDLYSIVGRSNSDGMRYSIVQIQKELGDNSDSLSIKGRILLTEQGIRDLNLDISRLNDLLGVGGSGSSGSFAERVDELELQMNGDVNGDTEFERIGMYQFAYNIYQQSPIGDAPDNELYFRSKNKWVRMGSETVVFSEDKGISGPSGNMIESRNGKIVVGGAPIVAKGEIEEAVFRDRIRMIKKDATNTDIEKQFISMQLDSAGKETYQIGETESNINIPGNLLIAGVPVGQGNVVDIPEDLDGSFVRTKTGWSRTDENDLPIRSLVSTKYDNDGKEIEFSRKTLLDYQDVEGMTVGSDDFETKIKTLNEISTSGLKVVDGIGTVLQTTDTRVVSGRPLYVGTSKVWTDAIDAPKDGEYYARIDGAWSKIDPTGQGSGTGIPDAPNDDSYYLRRNNAWTVLGESNISLLDNRSIEWETSTPGNSTGMSYNKTLNELSIGGSGAVIKFVGSVQDIILNEGSSLLGRAGSSPYNLITTNSDSEILIGSTDAKSVTLRGKESPKVMIGSELHTIITSKDEAPIDGKMYGRLNGAWKPFEVNRTLDIILNNGYSYKVADSKGKIISLATSGADNMIRVGQANTFMNFDSTIRNLKLDNKVMIHTSDETGDINLLGMNDTRIILGDVSKDLRVSAKSVLINGSKVWTSADDVPTDGNKYVRQDGKWEKAYSYGFEAPNSVGAKEGDVYFQYM